MAKLEAIPACALVMLALMVGSGWSLICRNCFSSESFDKCKLMGPQMNCTADVVNEIHARFIIDNPTLLPGNGTEFKCFRFNAWRKYPNGTDTGFRGFGQGCTFNSTDFCKGWDSSVNMTSCSTCTKDNCDEESSTPTDTPPVTNVPTSQPTTTATAQSTTTATTQSTSTATTKKPSNGATGLQQQMQLGAVMLVLLNVILGARN